MADLERFGLVPKMPDVLDHSFTGTYLECERMGYYQGVLGRRLNRMDQYALVWGTVFHMIADAWISRKDLNEVINIITANIPEDVEDRYGRTQRRMQEAFLEWAKFRERDPI